MDTEYKHHAETLFPVKTVVDNGTWILQLFTLLRGFLVIVRKVRYRNLTRFVLTMGDSPCSTV